MTVHEFKGEGDSYFSCGKWYHLSTRKNAILSSTQNPMHVKLHI